LAEGTISWRISLYISNKDTPESQLHTYANHTISNSAVETSASSGNRKTVDVTSESNAGHLY